MPLTLSQISEESQWADPLSWKNKCHKDEDAYWKWITCGNCRA